MSATKAVADAMDRLTPEPGESVENLAERMFCLQMEIYSALAGMTLCGPGDWETISEEDREAWFQVARGKIKAQ